MFRLPGTVDFDDPDPSQQVPGVPDMQGAQFDFAMRSGQQTPNVKQAPPDKGGIVKRMLTGLVQGASEAAMHYAGIPTPYEKQLAEQNYQLQLKKAQTDEDYKNILGKQYEEAPPMQLPDGTVIQGQTRKGQDALNAVLARVQGQKAVAGIQAGGRIEAAKIAQGQGITIDQTLASKYGLPTEMVGKEVPITQLAKLSGAAAKNITFKDIGGRAYMVDKTTGEKLKDLGESNAVTAGVQRAWAFAKARASMTPVTVQDPVTNEVKTISALEAVQTGIPIVNRPSGEKIASKTALFSDIRASLKQVRDNADVLDSGSANRGKLAVILADPNTTIAKFAQSGLAEALSEKERDYVINVINAREQINGLRNVIGMGQGSDLQRKLILQTMPGASTPDSAYANKQIDTALKVLDRLETGIQKLGPSGNSPKVGDVKTFPNGRKGKWDGIGWVPQ